MDGKKFDYEEDKHYTGTKDLLEEKSFCSPPERERERAKYRAK